ncbi:MAG: hypothetical protein ACRC0G_16035 [Fusobacteriaceae bacterium]
MTYKQLKTIREVEMKIELKIINNNIQFIDLVGKTTFFLEREMQIYDWDNNHKDCGIIINNLSGVQVGVERVSLGLGLEIFIEKMAGFGFEIKIVQGFAYSQETIQKAQALTVAGFSKLIKENDNYSVDNIFAQNFLTQEELEYLLSEEKEEILLSDIK